MAEAASVMNGISLGFCGGGGALSTLPIFVGGELLGSASFSFISLESDASLLFGAFAAELLSAKAAADAGTKGIEGPFIAEAAHP